MVAEGAHLSPEPPAPALLSRRALLLRNRHLGYFLLSDRVFLFLCVLRDTQRGERTNERTNERRRRRRRRSTMATRGDTKCCERLEGGLKHVMQCRYIDRLPSTCCCCAHEVCDERARKCAAGFRFSTCDDELMSEFGMMRIYIERARVFSKKK